MKLSVRLPLYVCLSIAPVLAQPGQQLTGAMAENNKILRQYTYKQRTEVLLNGESRMTRINQVHYDAAGKRQLTLISETGGEEAHGLGSRIINKKREEMKDYVMRLTALVEQYFPVDADKLRSMIPNAEIGPAANNLMSVRIRNFLKKGDSVTLMVDPGTRKLSRLELNTNLDKDSISMTTDLTTAASGPSYPSLTTIKAPAKNLEIRISSYELQKA
jgi:hypothetical protein